MVAAGVVNGVATDRSQRDCILIMARTFDMLSLESVNQLAAEMVMI